MRFIITYSILVGAPLVALFLILELGGSIRPPTGIGGSWQLSPGSPQDRPSLEVVQSGPVLELRWGDARGRGRLSGRQVEGRVGAWTLLATASDEAKELTGTLTRGDPADVVSFVATRARRPRGKGH